MKRILSLLLVLTIAVSAAVCAAAAEKGEADSAEVIETPLQEQATEQQDEYAQAAEEPAQEPEEPGTESPAEAPAVTAEETQAPTGRAADTRDKSVAATAADDMPRIIRVSVVKDGAKIEYSSFSGAYKYRVFYKGASGWKKIADTAALSYVHKNTTVNATTVYTVRAIDKNGAFCSAYDKAGYTFKRYATPKLKSAVSVYEGIKFSWEAVNGAECYRVFYNDGSGWQGAGNTAETSYIYTKAASGAQLRFTARVYNKKDKASISYYDTKGLTVKYVAAPSIASFTPADGGTKIKINKTEGADAYRVFYKGESGWKKIADTNGAAVTHSSLEDGVTYKYTVRALDKKKSYISGYNSEGWDCIYIAPVRIDYIVPMSGDMHLSWTPKVNVAAYRVFRKTFSSEWTVLGDTAGFTYTDSTVEPDVLYAYTLRCLDANGKYASYFNKDAVYYLNGAPADGTVTVGGSPVRFDKGYVCRGFVTIDGKTYYYDENGVLQKNGVVGSDSEGWRYADKNGVIDMTFTGIAKGGGSYWYVKKGIVDKTLRDGITCDGSKWNVLNGWARKVTTEEDKVLYRALKLVNKVTDKNMTKAQKLKKMWDYVKDAYVEKNPRIPHYRGMDWPIIYANDMLINGVGNCMSYGAEFCYIAKSIGYKKIYACHSGGHGWAEIEGLIYDPEWARHRHQYSYYGLSYDTRTDQDYKGAISAGLPWMHVKICADYPEG